MLSHYRRASILSALVLLLLAAPIHNGLVWLEPSRAYDFGVIFAPPLNDEPSSTPSIPQDTWPKAPEKAGGTSQGPTRTIVIAVDFADYNHTLSTQTLEAIFFGQMNEYFKEASYGRFYTTGKIVGWYRLSESRRYYGGDGLGIDDSDFNGSPNSWWLIRDAVNAADKDVDFSEYDNLAVIHAGFGEESSKDPDDLWSVAYFSFDPVRTRTKTIASGIIVPEFEAQGASPLGVYAHEFAHISLNLPDLYDTSTRTSRVGPWDLMDAGLWNGSPKGSKPAHLLIYLKISLGWIGDSEITVANDRLFLNATIQPSASRIGGYRALKVPLRAQGPFYLVEFRERVGFDSGIPSSGLLVTLIDESALTMSQGIKVIDANLATQSLNDAAFGLGQIFTDDLNKVSISPLSMHLGSFRVGVDRRGPIADLIVKRISLDKPAIRANSIAQIKVEISNQGSAEASNFEVQLEIDSRPYQTYRLSLLAGESRTLTTRWNATSGTHSVKVSVDPKASIVELNKNNNILVFTLAVGFIVTVELPEEVVRRPQALWIKLNERPFLVNDSSSIDIGVVEGPVMVEVQPVIILSGQTRVRFAGWSDGDRSNPREFYVKNDIVLKPAFKQQFLVDLKSNGGKVSGDGWYDKGMDAVISVTTPVRILDNARLVFTGWTGSMNSNATSVKVRVEGPLTFEANWKRQFYLELASKFGETRGSGWYDVNSMARFSVSSKTYEEKSTRHVFSGWVGDAVQENYEGSTLMDRPKKIVASWRTQHYVAAVSSFGGVRGSGWYSEGDMATVTLMRPVEYENDTRRVFLKWVGEYVSSSPEISFRVERPILLNAEWLTQHRVAFKFGGLPSRTSLVVYANERTYSLRTPEETSDWFNDGTQLQFGSNSTVRDGLWQYKFMRWTNATGGPVFSPQNIKRPETFTAVYVQQFSPRCLIATATFGSELAMEVQLLRNFRDNMVRTTVAGGRFMDMFDEVYYSFSPIIANAISGNEALRVITRHVLFPLIEILKVAQQTYLSVPVQGEVAILLAGITTSLLIGSIYLLPVFLAIAAIAGQLRRRGNTRVLTILLGATVVVEVFAFSIAETLSAGWLIAISSGLLVVTLMLLPQSLLLYGMSRCRTGSRSNPK